MVPKIRPACQNEGRARPTPPGRQRMRIDLERVRANVREAATEDLLDRATVFRAGMEPEALPIIDEELQRRGVGPAELAEHAERRKNALTGADGLALRCQKCDRPAVYRAWGLHRLWGW